MLGSLRKASSGFFAKVLLGLLAASFAVWGIGDGNSGRKHTTVATVDGEPIYLSELKAAVDNVIEQSGGNITPEMSRMLQLPRLKLESLINRRLLMVEAEALGIRIGDKQLADSLAANPNFHNNNGEFDKQRFRLTLRQMGVPEKAFLETTRKQTTASMVLNSLPSRSLVKDELLHTLYELKHQQRKITVGMINSAPAAAKPQPTDDDLQAYYEENKNNYTAPEYRALEYVLLDPKALNASITVSRQEAFDLYQERAADYLVPEKRTVSQLLYNSKADAENAYSELIKGKTIESIAVTIKPSNKKLSLGDVFKNQLSTGGTQVFALGVKEFTPPIESAFGFHIFTVSNIVEAHTSPFEEIQNTLEDELRQDKAGVLLTTTQEQVEDAIAAGMSLKEAADNQKLEFVVTSAVDKFGKSSDNEQIIDNKRFEDMMAVAFKLERDEQSELNSIADGVHYIVRAADITPARVRAYNEISGIVMEDWKTQQAHNALDDHASNVSDRLAKRTGTSAAKFRNESVKSTTTTVIDMNGIPAQSLPVGALKAPLPQGIIEDIYALRKSTDVTQAYPYGAGFIIAALDSILPAPALDSAQGKRLYMALERSITEQLSEEFDYTYVEDLRRRHPVEVNEGILNAYMNQDANTQQ